MIEGAKIQDSMNQTLRLLSLCERERTEEEARSAAKNFFREQRRYVFEQGTLILKEAKVLRSE